MRSEKYRFAGLVVQIESSYVMVHIRSEEYRCQDDPPADLVIGVSQEEIEAEQIKSREEAILEGREPQTYHPAYLEWLAIYRKMAKAMLLDHDILLFHGSAIAVGDQAVLFTALSGTGKSTHTALWRDMLGERCYMVNDDKPMLRVGMEGTQVCGTPWNGKHRLGTNCIVPLKAICILERGETNWIEQLQAKDVLPMLLQQSFRPDNPKTMLKLLKVIDKMAMNVKFYRLHCNMDPEAARVSYEAMLGE